MAGNRVIELDAVDVGTVGFRTGDRGRGCRQRFPALGGMSDVE